jgi:hypothetical protein
MSHKSSITRQIKAIIVNVQSTQLDKTKKPYQQLCMYMPKESVINPIAPCLLCNHFDELFQPDPARRILAKRADRGMTMIICIQDREIYASLGDSLPDHCQPPTASVPVGGAEECEELWRIGGALHKYGEKAPNRGL